MQASISLGPLIALLMMGIYTTACLSLEKDYPDRKTWIIVTSLLSTATSIVMAFYMDYV